MKTPSVLTQLSLCLLLLGAAAPASADEDRHRGDRGDRGDRDRREERHEWHGNIREFHQHDLDFWRGGRWFRGPHDGRHGWWWIVGGLWYFYPSPVYPYPDPYQPPVVVVAPEPPAPPHYVYYCNNPAGYYPYVPRCLIPWQRVLSAPTPPPPLEGMPPPGN
jgi:hypothetical protein